MLRAIRRFQDSPEVIVTSRLADDRLWAEALNLGAYDVLTKPFDRHEVLRSVSFAWLNWHDKHRGRSLNRLRPMMPLVDRIKREELIDVQNTNQ